MAVLERAAVKERKGGKAVQEIFDELGWQVNSSRSMWQATIALRNMGYKCRRVKHNGMIMRLWYLPD